MPESSLSFEEPLNDHLKLSKLDAGFASTSCVQAVTLLDSAKSLSKFGLVEV
jgi:hypothetical protein